MNYMENNNIYIYGGTFDPIHNGHMEIIKYLSNLDKSLVIAALAENPRWKTPVASVEDRKDMLTIAINNTHIKNYEIEEDIYPYTIDNVQNIIHKYGKDNRYYLVIGSDQVRKFNDWHKARELNKLVDILYVPRSEEVNSENIKKYNMKELPIKTLDICSTDIRNGKTSYYTLDYGVSKFINNYKIYMK